MTTVESILTRELNLRFIDARMIAAEAKVSLGIEGYPTPEQIPALHLEAERIFYSRSSEERSMMHQVHAEFESMKKSVHSAHSSDDESSVVSSSHTTSRSHRPKGFRLFRSNAV